VIGLNLFCFVFTSGPDDKWHESKKADIVKLETQLKKLQKKVETIVRQRKELGSSVASFWVSP